MICKPDYKTKKVKISTKQSQTSHSHWLDLLQFRLFSIWHFLFQNLKDFSGYTSLLFSGFLVHLGFLDIVEEEYELIFLSLLKIQSRLQKNKNCQVKKQWMHFCLLSFLPKEIFLKGCFYASWLTVCESCLLEKVDTGFSYPSFMKSWIISLVSILTIESNLHIRADGLAVGYIRVGWTQLTGWWLADTLVTSWKFYVVVSM